jgi:subtilisin family serine protease
VFSGFDDEEDNSGIVQTENFKRQSNPRDREPRIDYSANGHGTMVASKILGQWGTAKGVTLVPVQILPNYPFDMAMGFDDAFRHFIKKRQKNRDLQAVSAIWFIRQESCVVILRATQSLTF